MADNFLYIPELNPVIFFEPNKILPAAYGTKHFDDYAFSLRGHGWLQRADYKQIWQTTDIIRLQFISNFDPITVTVHDQYGSIVITLPFLNQLADKFRPGYYAYEIECSLATLAAGCYYMQVLAGTGITAKTLISDTFYVSDAQIEESLLMEYSHIRYHRDIIFETGIVFQYRTFGWIDYDNLEKPRKDNYYRDIAYNPELLNSRSAKTFPVNYGDESGIPSDHFNLIDEIWSCNNVLIDGKPFGMAEGAKFEFNRVDGYRLHGVKTMIEPGINRHSRIYAVETDTNKKLITSVIVDAKVFGDTASQGSSNAVPVINIE